MAFDAVETPEKIEMPPGAAKFAVGDSLQPDSLLLFDDRLDLAIFYFAQRCGADLILGVAFVIGIGGAVGYLALLSIFPIVAFVAAAIYLVDVRPKVRSLKPGTRQGPYGPW